MESCLEKNVNAERMRCCFCVYVDIDGIDRFPDGRPELDGATVEEQAGLLPRHLTIGGFCVFLDSHARSNRGPAQLNADDPKALALQPIAVGGAYLERYVRAPAEAPQPKAHAVQPIAVGVA